MRLLSLFSRRAGKSRTPGRRLQPSARSRPHLECLEDRCLLSTNVIDLANIPTPNSLSTTIVLGPDGNFWITESAANKIGRMTPDGVITEFQVPTTVPPNPQQNPTGSSRPIAIAVGPDGNIWFTELLGNKVAKITTAGVITEFTLPAPNSQPGGITTGPDGNIWFTERTPNTVARITPSGTITEFPIPSTVPVTSDNPTGSSDPRFIRLGSDGALWFTELLANKIGRITTAGTITEFQVPTTVPPAPVPVPVGVPPMPSSNVIGSSEPRGLILGPDGNMWFTEFLGSKIGRITPAGVITEFPTPTPGIHPFGINVGQDGNLWFAENTAGAIGVISTSGTFLGEFGLPTANSGPIDIEPGIGNTLVVVEAGANKIAKIFVATGGPNQRFVEQLYRDLLHRDADTNGLAYFSTILDMGLVSRSQVILAISTSLEARVNQVEALYQKVLHRFADPGGLTTYVLLLNGGMSTTQVEAILLGSPEYQALHSGGSAGFLNGVYQDVLGRAPDQSGSQFWTQTLAQGASAGDVASGILNSLEGDTVAMQALYVQYLHRPADPLGLNAFVAELQAGATTDQAVLALLNSAEYSKF
jgi:virginiamycin B lyase